MMPAEPRSSDPAASASLGKGLNYPLIEALRWRRSRRFSMGMKMESGPLAYKSRFEPLPLTEEEEAALVYAGCGITGYALGDLCYAPGEGGSIMAGLLGRTVGSGDGIQTVALVVANDRGTYFCKRPRDFDPGEIPELIELGREGRFLEVYQRSRFRIKEGRAAPPLDPIFNINCNRWSAHAPGTSYFLPINDLTFMYINGLLDIFNETTGVFVVDDRAGFRPAGLGKFARSKGGHLEDDLTKGRVATVKQVEMMVSEFVAIEAGMVLQNLGLAAQSMGLGGYPNFANHDFGWFQALGFRMQPLPASRYLGAGRVVSWGLKLMGKDAAVPYAVGLEREGRVLMKAYCPPYFGSMKEAVEAVVLAKTGPEGVFHANNRHHGWKSSEAVAGRTPRISEAAIAAATAYCDYVWERYGRFPAHVPPFRTIVGYQAGHVDAEFYDRFYRPEALGETQRADFRENEGRPRG